MVNPFEQTPAEKEEYVLDMLERGYSYPQIMKECHVSPNTISSVKKKFFGSAEDDASKSASQISKETQALKLFGEGKTLFQVATELDIATDFVFVIYQNFQRLRNMEKFISMYEQVKGNIQPFLHLFDLMNGLGMTPVEVAQLAGFSTRLPFLANIHSKLCNDVQILESQRRYLVFQLNCAQNQLERFNASIQFYHKECEMKRNELLSINTEIYTKESVIQILDNDKGYTRIKEAARKETKLIMQNNYVLSTVTLSATLEAMRRYPENQTLLEDIVTLQSNSKASYQQAWMESHTPQLMQLIGDVQNEIAERITSMVVGTMKSIT